MLDKRKLNMLSSINKDFIIIIIIIISKVAKNVKLKTHYGNFSILTLYFP